MKDIVNYRRNLLCKNNTGVTLSNATFMLIEKTIRDAYKGAELKLQFNAFTFDITECMSDVDQTAIKQSVAKKLVRSLMHITV